MLRYNIMHQVCGVSGCVNIDVVLSFLHRSVNLLFKQRIQPDRHSSLIRIFLMKYLCCLLDQLVQENLPSLTIISWAYRKKSKCMGASCILSMYTLGRGITNNDDFQKFNNKG